MLTGCDIDLSWLKLTHVEGVLTFPALMRAPLLPPGVMSQFTYHGVANLLSFNRRSEPSDSGDQKCFFFKFYSVLKKALLSRFCSIQDGLHLVCDVILLEYDKRGRSKENRNDKCAW